MQWLHTPSDKKLFEKKMGGGKYETLVLYNRRRIAQKLNQCELSTNYLEMGRCLEKLDQLYLKNDVIDVVFPTIDSCHNYTKRYMPTSNMDMRNFQRKSGSNMVYFMSGGLVDLNNYSFEGDEVDDEFTYNYTRTIQEYFRATIYSDPLSKQTITNILPPYISRISMKDAKTLMKYPENIIKYLKDSTPQHVLKEYFDDFIVSVYEEMMTATNNKIPFTSIVRGYGILNLKNVEYANKKYDKISILIPPVLIIQYFLKYFGEFIQTKEVIQKIKQRLLDTIVRISSPIDLTIKQYILSSITKPLKLSLNLVPKIASPQKNTKGPRGGGVTMGDEYKIVEDYSPQIDTIRELLTSDPRPGSMFTKEMEDIMRKQLSK